MIQSKRSRVVGLGLAVWLAAWREAMPWLPRECQAVSVVVDPSSTRVTGRWSQRVAA